MGPGKITNWLILVFSKVAEIARLKQQCIKSIQWFFMNIIFSMTYVNTSWSLHETRIRTATACNRWERKKFHIWRWIHSHRIMQTIYMIWFSGSKYCFLYFRREVYCINFETIERNCCKSNTKYATITWIANEEKRGWNDGEFNWGWKLYDYRPIFFMHLSG